LPLGVEFRWWVRSGHNEPGDVARIQAPASCIPLGLVRRNVGEYDEIKGLWFFGRDTKGAGLPTLRPAATAVRHPHRYCSHMVRKKFEDELCFNEMSKRRRGRLEHRCETNKNPASLSSRA